MFALLLLIASASCWSFYPEYEKFKEYAVEYNKHYPTPEI